MKKINKLELGLVIFALFFTSIANVNGLDINKEISTYNSNDGIIKEQYISVPDSTVLLRLWEQETDNGEIFPYYSISLDGGETFVRTVQPSYELGLRYAHFDPLVEVPTVESILNSGSDTHLFIVQFLTQPLEEYKEAIQSLGGFVRQYIAQYAYLVEMSNAVKLQVESLPYVRWIGPYHPAYKLEEFMIENFENSEEMYPIQRYNIQVHTSEMKQIVANKIEDIGGTLIKSDAGKFLVEATLTPDQLFAVARFDEVNFIDRWSELEPDMDIGREIGGANYVETVAGYTGEGVRGEMFDTGCNVNHVDFQLNPLIVHGPSCGSDSHGTACSGICFGTGTGNVNARGLLPDGQGIVADYSIIGLTGPSRYTHSGELVQDPYYAVFQTSSVGSDRTTQYTTISADSDAAIFDFDLVHCQSQSNAGDQMSRPQAWAKNMVSGGAVYHYDTLIRSDDMWNYGASIGPASDGRIKPTFAFFYDDIMTVGWPGNTDYTYSFGGTSGATPMIAGHIGLFFQMWSDGIFGNTVDPSGTVFENKAHFTTAKAMLINTAYQYPFTGTSHDKTRVHQGWGMPDLKNLYDLREKIYVIDETDVLEPFYVASHVVTVEQGSPNLKVTMTYADTPGNPAVQTQHRINDLTLKVISPTGTEYWGNYGLYESVWSSSGGSADTKNTVECVYVENPEQGAWTIEVYADEIIEDTHAETPGLDADYALVISPVISGPLKPIIDGPTEVEIGNEYDYTFVSTDPSEDDLYYFIYWGDGNIEDWFGPFESGEIVTVPHTWSQKGEFSITAKVKNSIGIESGLSLPLNVVVNAPLISIGIISGGLFFVKINLINFGKAEAHDVQWSLKLDGGAVLLGKDSSGIVDSIPANTKITVRSKLIIGFGETQFTANAEEPYGSSDASTIGGKLFGFYIKVNPGGG